MNACRCLIASTSMVPCRISAKGPPASMWRRSNSRRSTDAPSSGPPRQPILRRVKVTAKADYAVRAVLELATVDNGLVKGERIARAQGIPLKFLENILIDLRHAG